MTEIEKKKMLIYAHYYVPDVAATGQILCELAEGLSDLFDVTVICVIPSYEGKVDAKYTTHRFYQEEMKGVHLVRIRVPEFSKSNRISRIRNLISYFIGARKATRTLKNQYYDYVFTISQPPVLGGMLGVYGKKILRTAKGQHPKLIYNIHDFNPEQTMAVGYVNNNIILKAVLVIDTHSCKKSDLIITIGNDMVDTVNRRFIGKRVPNTIVINNWIDEKKVYPLPAEHNKVIEFKEENGLSNAFVIMYSGNLGLYYDLENLLKITKEFKNERSMDGKDVIFAFVGSGSILNKLKAYKDIHNLSNVIFIPYQDKDNLVYSLNAADVHWCVNAKGIKGVSVPSKIYGIMAVGKPVLGVMESGSEARILIEKTECGLVCEPEDYDSVKRNLRWFISNAGTENLYEMGNKGHDKLVKDLTKTAAISKYKRAILKL